MAFWTYLLRCSDSRFYTGHTEDLEVRLAQHQQGFFQTCWTYKRRPVELAWCETFPTRDEALTAERIVGGWSRSKKEALIRGDWKLVSFLACPPNERATRFPASGESRFSTALETNGRELDTPKPFVSSEVEKHEVEKRETSDRGTGR